MLGLGSRLGLELRLGFKVRVEVGVMGNILPCTNGSQSTL